MSDVDRVIMGFNKVLVLKKGEKKSPSFSMMKKELKQIDDRRRKEIAKEHSVDKRRPTNSCGASEWHNLPDTF